MAAARWSLACKLKNSKKKAKDGLLSFDAATAPPRLLFDWAEAAGKPQFALPLAAITDQMVSKGDDKAMMKVVTADASLICVLQFTSKQDQQATLTKLLELRTALTQPLPPVVLSGADRGKYLAKDTELRAQYQDLVAQGALRDEDFWKDDQLQERLVLERAERPEDTTLETSKPLKARSQPAGAAAAAASGGSAAAAVDLAAPEAAPLVDKDMSEHIFSTQPEVLAEYKRSVPSGRIPEGQFWEDYLKKKQGATDGAAGTAGAPLPIGGPGEAAGAVGAGDHLLDILRGAATKERGLHERRTAAGGQSIKNRQAEIETQPGAIGMGMRVIDRHLTNATEAARGVHTGKVIGEVFKAAVGAGGDEGEGEGAGEEEWPEGPQARDFSSVAADAHHSGEGDDDDVQMEEQARDRKRKRAYEDIEGSSEEEDGEEEDGEEEDGEEEEEDGWIDDITHWEPSSATALRTVHKRLVAESCAVSRSNPTDGQSIALGGGAAHLYGPTEAVVLAAADLTAGSNNPAAERYTSELKVAFTRSLQYLRHFWMAVRKDDRAKALRMHAALRQLFDTIETQNGKLGEDERARLAPLSRHLQQEMLRTALGNLPTPGDNG